MKDIEKFIPIKNLYYLLCYAWELADQRDKIKVDASDCSTYPDLFAKLLVTGCSILFKRGLYHEYVSHDENIIGIKGKWNVSDSLKSLKYRMGQMDCTFDEFSDDILVTEAFYDLFLSVPSVNTAFIHGENHEITELSSSAHRNGTCWTGKVS